MKTLVGFNEITILLDDPKECLPDPGFLLQEIGKLVECIAIDEYNILRIFNPLMVAEPSPLVQKPFTKYRLPISHPSPFGGRLSETPDHGIHISDLTRNSVTVSMPRGVTGKVQMRFFEIEEFVADYLRGSIRAISYRFLTRPWDLL